MSDYAGLFGILAVILIGGALFLGSGFFYGIVISDDIAYRALEANGFSNVSKIEKDTFFVDWKGGGNDDVVKFTVEATNPVGKQVKVAVFAGWPFKGATIRV